MAALVYLVLFMALTGHSSALYCICKDGVSTQALQKAIDYACGNGADCNPIQQNGACYNPNTVKDHCNWAVNSYFQKKGQAQLSCDFAGSATQSQTAPTTSTAACVFPSSASTTTTNSTTPSTGTTPSTTPSTTPTTGTTPTTSSTPSTIYGLSPTGSTAGINTESRGATLAPQFVAAAATIWFSTFLLLWG